MTRLLRFLFVIAAGASLLAAATPRLQRLARNVDGVVIEYSPGDEAYVDELVRRLADIRSLPTVKAPAGGELEMLEAQRASYLAAVASTLGLSAPTAEMTSFWPKFTDLFRTMGRLTADPVASARRYQLWRRPELIDRLQAGEKIPGFSLGGPSGLIFHLDFNFASPAEAAEFWRNHPLPIAIGAGPAPADDITAGVQKLRALSGSFSNGGGRTFLMLHEMTEVGIVWHYIGSPDRRWFCDGMANYVAWKTLRDKLGAAEAKKIYDLEAELKKYRAEAALVDLEKWPAAENMGQANYREDINTANYAFATQVIARVCAKHGDDLLPRWFAEIGKTPHAKTTMQTVYRAYTKLTGEDLHQYLPKPAKHCTPMTVGPRPSAAKWVRRAARLR